MTSKLSFCFVLPIDIYREFTVVSYLKQIQKLYNHAKIKISHPKSRLIPHYLVNGDKMYILTQNITNYNESSMFRVI